MSSVKEAEGLFSPKPSERPVEGANVVIGMGSHVEGQLKLCGRVELFGSVSGEVETDGELIVAESAELRAELRAKEVRIFGRVEGNVHASDRVELHTGAVVKGDIVGPVVVVQDGVVFEGHCSMPQESLSVETY